MPRRRIAWEQDVAGLQGDGDRRDCCAACLESIVAEAEQDPTMPATRGCGSWQVKKARQTCEERPRGCHSAGKTHLHYRH